ncbi:type III-A CRISPR-associated RAMP protein Csm5 [uncultured Selenomonas sp.]|uniref:type III-A CRISPR-associated RAMP protein Csm5 n=1 Tax=uncultured Selenomonas sp. TaxID=159275 RepID=UPI0028DB5BBE|nr:type III-A CRISPR-associated RAMP protein Csm5 [uncultured Selenomonas sp.]
MSGQIVRQEYELTCIAPVHVGSGQKLKSFEYLYDRRKDEVAFLNESKWIALLAQHDLMDTFADAVMSGAFLRQSIREWLLDHQIKEGELRSIILRRAASAPLITKERGRTKLNDIVAQTTLVDGRPYIPGSTIKGALRTGMLYHAIRRDPARFRSTWQEILRSLREPLRDQKKASDRMMSRVEQALLHTLCLSDDVKTGDAVSSAMRGLRVSDAVSTVRDTVVLQKVDATTKKKRQGENVSELPLFRECIPAGAKLRFAVTADLSMLETTGLRSLDEALAGVRAYTADGLRLQEKVFGKKYPALFAAAKNADALLGCGTGFLSKTLVYALAGSDEEAHTFIASYLDAAFQTRNRQTRRREPAHRHKELDEKISPRTLKRAVMGQDDWIMGLCSIRGIGDAQTI